MAKKDYGFYGSGTDGYVHYKQSFDSINKNRPSHSSTPPKQNQSNGNGGSNGISEGRYGLAVIAFIFFAIVVLKAISIMK